MLNSGFLKIRIVFKGIFRLFKTTGAGNQARAERRIHVQGREQAGQRLQPHTQPFHQM
jgi:hypothetical protein